MERRRRRRKLVEMETELGTHALDGSPRTGASERLMTPDGRLVTFTLAPGFWVRKAWCLVEEGHPTHSTGNGDGDGGKAGRHTSNHPTTHSEAGAAFPVMDHRGPRCRAGVVDVTNPTTRYGSGHHLTSPWAKVGTSQAHLVLDHRLSGHDVGIYPEPE